MTNDCSINPPAYCPRMEIALRNKLIKIVAKGLVSTFPGKDPDLTDNSIVYAMTSEGHVKHLLVEYCPFCGKEVPQIVGGNANAVREFLTKYKVIESIEA
jgi:hypothetical protein